MDELLLELLVVLLELNELELEFEELTDESELELLVGVLLTAELEDEIVVIGVVVVGFFGDEDVLPPPPLQALKVSVIKNTKTREIPILTFPI